jgi:hypothetical protein
MGRQRHVDRRRLLTVFSASLQREADGIWMGHVAIERLRDGGLQLRAPRSVTTDASERPWWRRDWHRAQRREPATSGWRELLERVDRWRDDDAPRAFARPGPGYGQDLRSARTFVVTAPMAGQDLLVHRRYGPGPDQPVRSAIAARSGVAPNNRFCRSGRKVSCRPRPPPARRPDRDLPATSEGGGLPLRRLRGRSKRPDPDSVDPPPRPSTNGRPGD